MITKNNNHDKEKSESRCLKCGRILKNQENIRIGYGAACYKRLIEQPMEGQITADEVIGGIENVSAT